MSTLVEQIGHLSIGRIEEVTAAQLHISLFDEAPQAMALNTGDPTGFPRINSYLLIPNERGAVVASIKAISVTRDKSETDKRSFEQPVALPASARMVVAIPFGTLLREAQNENQEPSYQLERGVPVLPSVGDPVLLPTQAQLRSIVEGQSEDRIVQIGTAPFAGDAPVWFHPDKMFGRHLAVLGNTGSGKSCSVAGIIRWSLEEARKENNETPLNARFIILDPNGEYSAAFRGDELPARRYAADGGEYVRPLSVPGWLWNTQEWAAFTSPSPQVQFPTLVEALRQLKNLTSPSQKSISANAPVHFNITDLPDQINSVVGQGQASYVESFVSRIRIMLEKKELMSIIESDNDAKSLSDWISEFLGPNDKHSEPLSIIDLSLVPAEVIHVVVAVIGRLMLEALQRHTKRSNSVLPTVLVLEEAHKFIRRDANVGEIEQAHELCRQTFERIAREGRKFGMGLVLASQRPSELSPTVLAQCNSFLLHRIVNDLDQKLVRELVPDKLSDLLRELPTLPSQQAILLGWAVSTPVLVKIQDLESKNRPRSDDPKFWSAWKNTKSPSANWSEIAADWGPTKNKENDEQPEDPSRENSELDDDIPF